MLQPVFALALLTVRHVQHHKQRGARDEDELQGPEAGVGDGEEVVEADIVATGLPRVAVKVLLIVAPHLLGGHHEHHEPEDEHHREPDAAEGGGVLVHPAQEPLEKGPIHAACFSLVFSLRTQNMNL